MPVPTPSAWIRSASSWFCDSFCDEALATFRILPRNGRMAWVSRLRALLAEPPAESPSTMKISVPAACWIEQSASLPGRRSLRVADWRPTSFSRLPLQALLGLVDGPFEEPRRLLRAVRQPVVEGVLDGRLDDAARLLRRELVLGLALELGLADEDGRASRPPCPSRPRP